MSWYQTCYRKLFFDFHSPGTAVGLASRFDAEQWADRLLAINAQAVSVFTKCGFGYSFYQKGSIRYQHPHLPEGLDMLEKQIIALHKRGLKTIGYYETFHSEPIAHDYPQWRTHDKNGVPDDTEICMISPMLEEWMLPHIEEIITNYDVDAMFFDGTRAKSACYCDACQERYALDHAGKEIPRSKEDPEWPEYVRWKIEIFKGIRQSICDTIHRHRPEIIISFNWVYAPFQVERVPDSVGALAADIYCDDQVFHGSRISRYWNTLERPFDVMNTAFLQWWGDWGCKPAIGMQQEVATVLANGGLSWIGYQMNQAFDVEPAVLNEMGKVLDFIKERENLYMNVRPLPYVAVLHSKRTREWNSPAEFSINEKSIYGITRVLNESMIPFQIFHEDAMLKRLNEFKVIVLADQQILSSELVSALEAWVSKGGVLIAAGLNGIRDITGEKTGRFALGKLLGIKLDGIYDQPHAYIKITDERLKPNTLDMPHLGETTFALAKPVATNVEVLAKLYGIYLRSDGKFLLRWSPIGEDTGCPAVTLRRVGYGYAVYIAGDIFYAYQVKNQWNFKYIIANLIDVTVAEKKVQVRAPAWLEVTLAEQTLSDGRRRELVHLINWHGNRPVGRNELWIEQLLPVYGVTVQVPWTGEPSRVILEPEGVEPKWNYNHRTVSIQVPVVNVHTVVAIE